MYKKCVDGFSPFRPILSILQTPICKPVKFLVPISEPLTTNKYTVKDSFNFATKIVDQDSSNSMGSLDIDSLFTNISLEESIGNCINELLKNNDIVHGLKESELKDFLSLPQKSRILYLIMYYTNKLMEQE